MTKNKILKNWIWSEDQNFTVCKLTWKNKISMERYNKLDIQGIQDRVLDEKLIKMLDQINVNKIKINTNNNDEWLNDIWLSQTKTLQKHKNRRSSPSYMP